MPLLKIESVAPAVVVCELPAPGMRPLSGDRAVLMFLIVICSAIAFVIGWLLFKVLAEVMQISKMDRRMLLRKSTLEDNVDGYERHGRVTSIDDQCSYFSKQSNLCRFRDG